MSETPCKICPMTSGVDYHHEIPQAYGGTNGPQTPLCSGHHSLVHNLAHILYKSRDEAALPIPEDVPKQNRQEVLRLVRTIVIARDRYEAAKAVGQAPRKGGTVKVDGKRMERVDKLAQLLRCSQQAVIHQAIDRLHQSMTTRAANT